MTFKDNEFDTVVDTFGLEYYLNPRKAIQEMQRVCKDGGLILLMNQGSPDSKILNWYYRFHLPYYLMNYGYFPHRPWDKIIDTTGLEVIQRRKLLNGSVHYQILKNNKSAAKPQK